MNALGRILSFWFALVLLAPDTYAQDLSEATSLPEGIVATGDTLEVRTLLEWAKEYREFHPEQAGRIAERALTLARNLDDQRWIAESLMILGYLALDFDRKEVYYTEAQAIFEQIGDEHGLHRSHLAMGTVYAYRGELEQALIHYFNALEGFEHLNDTKEWIGALTAIGIAHTNQGNAEEALSYFEQATTYAELLNEPLLLVSVFINLGGALAEGGAHERAETILRRALAISEEQELPRYTAAISNNLGYLFNLQGHHENALLHLYTAERLAKELGEDWILMAVYNQIGNAYMGLAQYDRASFYAAEGLTLAQEKGSDVEQMSGHQTLSRIYEAAGHHEQALVHYQQYTAARDSIHSVEKAEIITRMQTRYETEEKQRAIEQLEQQNQINTLQRTLLLVGVGSLLLLLGFLYYRYRTKQKANRLLEELDAAKSRFFANISHEFRTPLTVILGSMQEALAGRFDGDTEKLTEHRKAVLRNTRRLQCLIDEVLDLNRLESGHLELRLAPGDLIQSLKHIVEANAPLAERNGITLTLTCDVESCLRLYDEEKLQKIVGNMLSNALKFTPREGSVQVNLHSKDPIEISVTDDGPGIPVEEQTKVFERFAQLDHGILKGGTGIGLALVKELAELHRGTITLESAPGTGSTFTVRLPLERVTLAGFLEETNRHPQTIEEFEVGGDGHTASRFPSWRTTTKSEGDRTTALIIEDNDDVRAYIRRALEEVYRVIEAVDGETGLQQAQTELPDLIVSDVMLPDVDGYTIARQLKATIDTECIPVVMLTARAAEEDQIKGYGSGAEIYITKPFSPETLRAACARLLEERRRLRLRLQKETQETEEEDQEDGYPTLHTDARTTVLENLHNEEFGVEELASALHMSRQTLYNRFKSEIGLSPSDFVRTLRLEHARRLLSRGAGSVAEVAYAVGFNSLVAFSRAYSTHFGTPPSSHLRRHKKATE